MYEERLLAGLRIGPPAAEGAVRVQMRLPWYRSLQLSCIEQLDLKIDGEVQPADRLQVVVNGDAHPLSDVAGMHESWWFVLDTIDLQVAARPPLSPGIHRISVALKLRIPYGDPDFRPELNIRQAVTSTKDLILSARGD